jgi:hypothetical protein
VEGAVHGARGACHLLDELVGVARADLAVEERGVPLDLDQLETASMTVPSSRAVLTSACARLIRWVLM